MTRASIWDKDSWFLILCYTQIMDCCRKFTPRQSNRVTPDCSTKCICCTYLGHLWQEISAATLFHCLIPPSPPQREQHRLGRLMIRKFQSPVSTDLFPLGGEIQWWGLRQGGSKLEVCHVSSLTESTAVCRGQYRYCSLSVSINNNMHNTCCQGNSCWSDSETDTSVSGTRSKPLVLAAQQSRQARSHLPQCVLGQLCGSVHVHLSVFT